MLIIIFSYGLCSFIETSKLADVYDYMVVAENLLYITTATVWHTQILFMLMSCQRKDKYAPRTRGQN